ncbi:TlpA disulfide reductase family protein [Mucilaginibacter sp. L196]|uniref:TlpA disulfide reductase family protein n=1 Tax=Mucilaginibacter sp. L196 TaxID=1641870 RepID=UPI00131B9FBC|nr:TlpA disulfide reductase family protein [Mucilaginibacter sp. L196]
MQILKLLPLIGISAGLLTHNPNTGLNHNVNYKTPAVATTADIQQTGTGSFTLKGQLPAKFDSPLFIHIYYINSEGRYTNDSCVFNKGAFEFKGSVSNPETATLVIQGPGYSPRDERRQLWLEAGIDITLKSDDHLKTSIVSNSQLNVDQEQLNAILQPYADQSKAIMTAYRKALKTPGEKAAKKKYNDDDRKASDGRDAAIRKFIRDNPNSYLSLEELNAMTGDTKVSHADFKSMYDSLSASVKNTEDGKTIGLFVANRDVVVVGSMAPAFIQNDVNGKPVSLSSFRGKYVFVDFWASWCVPCREENPDVVKAYNKFKSDNFTMLGVSLDNKSSKAAWLKAIKTDKLSWTQVCDLKGWNNDAAGLYAVRAVPANFLIDPHGKIVATDIEGAALETTLNKLLKQTK